VVIKAQRGRSYFFVGSVLDAFGALPNTGTYNLSPHIAHFRDGRAHFRGGLRTCLRRFGPLARPDFTFSPIDNLSSTLSICTRIILLIVLDTLKDLAFQHWLAGVCVKPP